MYFFLTKKLLEKIAHNNINHPKNLRPIQQQRFQTFFCVCLEKNVAKASQTIYELIRKKILFYLPFLRRRFHDTQRKENFRGEITQNKMMGWEKTLRDS